MNVCNSSEISSLSVYCSCKVLFFVWWRTHVDNHRLSQLSCFFI